MKSIPIVCLHCQETVSKPKKEIDRQVRQGRNTFFCSLSCSMAYKNKTDPRYRNSPPTPQFGNQYGKKGEFTYYLNKARQRSKRKGFEMDLDEEYLASIFDGRCAITGVEIKKTPRRKQLNSASLDRINSSKGYVKGNVQFVALPVNLAKSDFSDEEIRGWFNNIINDW